MDIITLGPGDTRYSELTAHLTAEPLRTQWWDDAESEHEPGVSYAMVIVDDVPAAWAGWIDDEPVLRCVNNYVRTGYRGRSPELYALAYTHRHREVVLACGLPAVTYLYPEPIPLHLADGWVLDTGADASGTSYARPGGEPHHWQRLIRPQS